MTCVRVSHLPSLQLDFHDYSVETLIPSDTSSRSAVELCVLTNMLKQSPEWCWIIANEISSWKPKFLELAELFSSFRMQYFPLGSLVGEGMGGKQGGTGHQCIPPGSRLTLTMQPTQRLLITTQQPNRKCNLKSIFLYKQLILWDFHFKFPNCSK